MPKVIVTPIDMTAKGSYRERKQLMRAYAAMKKATESGDIVALTDAYDELDALLLPHLETDDGSTVEDVLAEISADDYDRLFAALTAQETVPNGKSETSP